MRIALVVASALLAGTFACLSMAGSAEADEVQVGSAGDWRVVAVSDGGRLQYCAAEIDNAEVTLRIATDGASWQLGNPYYDAGPVNARWGFNNQLDEITAFRTDGDGWAVMNVDPHMLDGLRMMDTLSIQLDRGVQTWNISAFQPAMEKTLDCTRGKATAPSTGGNSARSVAVGWVPGNPDLPPDSRAVPVGEMPDGMQVFSCSARFNGGIHPGMNGMWIAGCSVGYGGQEIVVRDYDMMVGTGHWVRVRNGEVPSNAIRGGNEANGAPLYICRAKSQGLVYAGKTRPGFNGCNVPESGREITIRDFEILMP